MSYVNTLQDVHERYSTEEEPLLETLKPIIRDVIAPEAPSVDAERRFPTRGLRALGDAGFYALTVPSGLGGQGASAKVFSAVVSEIGRACASTAMVYVMHLTALNSIVQFADAHQRDRYLQPVVEGRWLVAEAISEPGSGSQWWSLSSTAESTGSGYHLRARKSFATAAGFADLYVVSTRAPGATSDRDHALFLVPADCDGIRAGQWQGMGLVGNMSAGMDFDTVVDADAMLFGGDDDSGLRLYNEANQPLYHLGVASVYAAIAEAALESTVGRVQRRVYSHNATAFGKKLSDYPVAQRHIGEMYARTISMRAVVDTLATQIDAGTSFEDLAVFMTSTKVITAEGAADVTRQAMMASGGAAYSRGVLPIERYMRDAAAASLMGPNDDFCKELVGRMLVTGSSYHEL